METDHLENINRRQKHIKRDVMILWAGLTCLRACLGTVMCSCDEDNERFGSTK
jgi:hypothetical protein